MPQVSNTPKQQTILQLEARKSFSLGLWFKLADLKQVVNLTGCEIRFVMKRKPHKGGAIVINQLAELLTPLEGYARLNLQAPDLDLDAEEYDFTIALLTAQDYSSVVLKGAVDLLENPDPGYTEEYAGVSPPQSLTFQIMDNNMVTVRVNHLQAPDIEIGQVVTVASGEEAAANLSGSYPLQILDLWLPAGLTGPPAELEMGTVDIADPGDPGSAEIVGVAPNFQLNLVLPQALASAIATVDNGDGTLAVSSPLLVDNGDGTWSLDVAGQPQLLKVPPNLAGVGEAGKVFGFLINDDDEITGFAEAAAGGGDIDGGSL